MTQLQLAYLAHEETVRANQAREGQNAAALGETARHNIAQEALAASAQSEQHRSNLVNERLKQDTLKETRRSNLVGEVLKRQQLGETRRQFDAQESLRQSQEYSNLTGSIRNLASAGKDGVHAFGEFKDTLLPTDDVMSLLKFLS